MESKKKPTKDALNNLFKLSSGLSRSEASRKYHNLSAKAREDVDIWVNQKFREATGTPKGFKIDPNNPDHQEYVREWLKQRDIIMSWTVDWEKQAGQKIETRYFSPDSKTMKEQPENYTTSTQREAKAILRQGFTGKEFLIHIEESFKKPYAEKEQVAYNIIRYAEDRHLINASRDPNGIKGLFQLYTLLVSKPDNGAYIQQANRILIAIGSLSNLEEGLVSKPYIVPAEFTLFDSSHITARLTKDNKVWVKLNVNSIEGHQEALTLGTEAFTTGITLDPHEWIRFKLYDEGGITVYRPALYLLQLSSKSTKETWTNMINVGFMGIPGGLFFGVGGLMVKGGRLAATLIKIEKFVDIAVNAFFIGNLVVRENRGWIIKNYGDTGRKFIEAFDLATTIAIFYGLSKAMTTIAMGKALEKTIACWDDVQKMKIDAKDFGKIKAIDKSVKELRKSLKEVKNLDETKKLTKVGTDRVKSLDDTAEITKVIRKRAIKRQPKKETISRETTKKLDELKKETSAQTIKRLTPEVSEESQLIFSETFTPDQVRNWKADNFWKTPKELHIKRARTEGDAFKVIIDKETNEVIGAYFNYSEKGLTSGVRADGISKLYDAKYDLVVRPDFRGRGVGGECIKEIVKDARKYEAQHIRLHASNAGSYRWLSNMKPIAKHAEGEGGRLVFKVDDLEASLKTRRFRASKDRVPRLERASGTGIGAELQKLETDADLQLWRTHRRVSSDEFRNWVRNLPEKERTEFMIRLSEGPVTNSVGNRRFVLRDAAHEIRVNKDLKTLGIKDVHGDFTGPGRKLKKEIADALSSKLSRDESKLVRDGIRNHNAGRPHHNPKITDDYLHKAIDEYDAVTDPLRNKKTGFGYKDPPMAHEKIRDIFVKNVKKSPEDRAAMETILKWKEKKISHLDVRKEYQRLLAEKGESIGDTVKIRIRDSRTPKTNEPLPKIREKPISNRPRSVTKEITKKTMRTKKL
jgi:GNAT superfamily N-acetyltransferase